MTTIILTIHILIVLALIGVVLLQRSEGGALGMGGGGGFLTGRGAANALTRTTSVLAALFFATSIALAMTSGGGNTNESVLKELTGAPTQQNAPDADGTPSNVNDLLKSLGSEKSGEAAPKTGQDVLNKIPEAEGDAKAAAPAGDASAPQPDAKAPASGDEQSKPSGAEPEKQPQ